MAGTTFDMFKELKDLRNSKIELNNVPVTLADILALKRELSIGTFYAITDALYYNNCELTKTFEGVIWNFDIINDNNNGTWLDIMEACQTVFDTYLETYSKYDKQSLDKLKQLLYN